MRDPKRINEVMDLMTNIWREFPDLRFNQLMHLLQVEYANEHPEYKKLVVEKETNSTIEPPYEHDMINLFYVEDDKWLEFLIDFKENL